MEEPRLMRDINRGTPGDQAIYSESKTPEQKKLGKRKSQHFNDAFAYRESNSSARERVERESMVIAEIRTNVIIKDEYTFITDLSYSLSGRYQRPESSILVTVTHSACLLFGGSFDPAYTMTITALPSLLQPVTNKRNASLLQKAMEEALGVVPERGLIKFVAIMQENIATNGKTVAGEIEDLDKVTSENHHDLKCSPSPGTARSNKRKNKRSMRNLKIGSPFKTHDEQDMIPPISGQETPPLPPMPIEKSTLGQRAERMQKMGRRKSFIAAVFGK